MFLPLGRFYLDGRDRREPKQGHSAQNLLDRRPEESEPGENLLLPSTPRGQEWLEEAGGGADICLLGGERGEGLRLHLHCGI